MLDDLKHNDEEGRLLALDRLEILDTPEEVPFEKVVNLIQMILKVPICAVSLVDRHRQWFKARRGLGVAETARDISFCTHTIRQPDPFVICNALDDARFRDNPLVTGDPFIRSYAGIPLKMSDGYNVGSLCAIDTKPRDFSKTEISILENFAKVVVDELELRQTASSDQLTGAFSRRAWIEKAKAEVVRAHRFGRPLSLAILDIDKFKSINDTCGHPGGDRVITSLAELSMATIRKSDLFGRLGGEEFGLLMPELACDPARVLVERLRALFANQPIDLGMPVHATVSIGVAEMNAGEADLDALILRADQALYKAKNQGRNRTVVADHSQEKSAIHAA